MGTLRKEDIDHEVVIVGWDDSIGAWIIKNSWGPDWGENGYMKLAFDNNNVGFNAAWITARSASVTPSSSFLNKLESINRGFKAE